MSDAAVPSDVLGLFAEYSPSYPCVLEGLTRATPLIRESFGGDGDPALNLKVLSGDGNVAARRVSSRLTRGEGEHGQYSSSGNSNLLHSGGSYLLVGLLVTL